MSTTNCIDFHAAAKFFRLSSAATSAFRAIDTKGSFAMRDAAHYPLRSGLEALVTSGLVIAKHEEGWTYFSVNESAYTAEVQRQIGLGL